MTEEEVFNKLAATCATAEHCRFEMKEKMYRWSVPLETINHILDKLEAEKYIDEERFSKAFVSDKFRFSKWGKQKIAQALYLKKIPQSVFSKYINAIDYDEYISTLKNLIDAKRKSVRANSDYELNGKLIRFAMSRGFKLTDIKCCISDFDELD